MNTTTTITTTFECEVCHGIFDKTHRVRHMKKHPEEYAVELKEKEESKQFECEFCKHKFSLKTNLTRHLKKCQKENVPADSNASMIGKRKRTGTESDACAEFEMLVLKRGKTETESAVGAGVVQETGSELIVSQSLGQLDVTHQINAIDQSSQPLLYTPVYAQLPPLIEDNNGCQADFIGMHIQINNIPEQNPQVEPVLVPVPEQIQQEMLYKPLSKVDAGILKAWRHRKHHLCIRKPFKSRHWQCKPMFMCTKPQYKGTHLKFPDRCYKRVGQIKPPIPSIGLLVEEEEKKEEKKPHLCICGKECTGIDNNTKEEEKRYKPSSHALKMIYNSTANAFVLQMKRKALQRQTIVQEMEQGYDSDDSDRVVSLDELRRTLQQWEDDHKAWDPVHSLNNFFQRYTVPLPDRHEQVLPILRSPGITEYEQFVVQQVLEKTKCARLNLAESKKVLKEINCNITTAESGEDEDTEQTVLLFKNVFQGYLEQGDTDMKDKRRMVLRAVFRHYMDPTEKAAHFDLKPYVTTTDTKKDFSAYTERDLTLKVKDGYVSGCLTNKKSLNQRFNEYCKFLNNIEGLMIIVQQCWKAIQQIIARKDPLRTECMVSLSKHCLEDLANDDNIDLKKRMKTLRDMLFILSDQQAPVLKYTREKLAEQSRCTQTRQQVHQLILRRDTIFSFPLKVLETLHMSRDFMMDTLLKTMFIVRREDNDTIIQELVVESHEYINIQAMEARKEEEETEEEENEEDEENGVEKGEERRDRGRITIRDLIRQACLRQAE